MTHTSGDTFVTILITGIYEVTWSVTATQANQFALVLDTTVVANSRYGMASGSSQNEGQIILSINSGQTLRLRNSSSTAANVSLNNSAGGTLTNVDASMVIIKLN